jgi:hypothetical protein
MYGKQSSRQPLNLPVISGVNDSNLDLFKQIAVFSRNILRKGEGYRKGHHFNGYG